MKHTELPWKVFNNTDIYPDDDDTFATRHIADCATKGYSEESDKIPCSQKTANAEYIVRACNCHDELVEVCKDAAKQFRKLSNGAVASQIEAVIAKAEKDIT